MIAEDSYLAVARISGPLNRYGLWPLTTGGDALSHLHPPFDVGLYQPDYRGSDLKTILKTALQPIPQGADLLMMQAVDLRLQPKKGRIRLRALQDEATTLPQQTSALPQNLQGWWICLPVSQLRPRSDDEYFVFELLEQPVFTAAAEDARQQGQVIHFFDNGAHGVLEVQLADRERTVLVPMVSAHVSFRPGRRGLVIPELLAFVVD
ncbi:MAG: hypothetical protein KDK39_02875 [Leptospiraceae bacterium]|nr:hypothetical protein [Leptospiraceae bacterium]